MDGQDALSNNNSEDKYLTGEETPPAGSEDEEDQEIEETEENKDDKDEDLEVTVENNVNEQEGQEHEERNAGSNDDNRAGLLDDDNLQNDLINQENEIQCHSCSKFYL